MAKQKSHFVTFESRENSLYLWYHFARKFDRSSEFILVPDKADTFQGRLVIPGTVIVVVPYYFSCADF